MTSEISSRAACLAELTSNPRSFFNCPDMHGGPGLPEGGAKREELGATRKGEAVRGKGEARKAELGSYLKIQDFGYAEMLSR